MGKSTKKNKEVTRSPNGRFVAGVSGNPKGRPKGARNRITQLKEEAELALRETVTPDRIRNVFEAMYNEALAGNVQAGKAILDKFVTNAKSEEEKSEGNSEIVISIKNLTLEEPKEVKGEIINQEVNNG